MDTMADEPNDDAETFLGRTFTYDPLGLTEYDTVQHSIAHVAVRFVGIALACLSLRISRSD